MSFIFSHLYTLHAVGLVTVLFTAGLEHCQVTLHKIVIQYFDWRNIVTPRSLNPNPAMISYVSEGALFNSTLMEHSLSPHIFLSKLPLRVLHCLHTLHNLRKKSLGTKTVELT